MPAEMTATHPDDAVLLAALRCGDNSAAGRMMQRHNRTLWRIARGVLGDDGEAEEAVQDTWLRAFTAARTYRGDASLGTWLARIAIHEALRRAERRRPMEALDPIADLVPLDHPGSATMPPPAGPEQVAARAEIGRIVEKAIDTLPWPFRVVFIMRVVEQMSTEETAAALEIPVATVKPGCSEPTSNCARRSAAPFPQSWRIPSHLPGCAAHGLPTPCSRDCHEKARRIVRLPESSIWSPKHVNHGT